LIVTFLLEIFILFIFYEDVYKLSHWHVLIFINIFISIWELYMDFHCGISMYTYIVCWFGSSPPLFFLFPLFLKWPWQVSMFHIDTCNRKYLYLNHLLHFLLLSSLSHYYPSFNMTFFILLSTHHFERLCAFLVGFCLGILPVNKLHFNQTNPLYYSSFPFSFCPILLVFSVFHWHMLDIYKTSILTFCHIC
jgi:hypothetical protein